MRMPASLGFLFGMFCFLYPADPARAVDALQVTPSEEIDSEQVADYLPPPGRVRLKSRAGEPDTTRYGEAELVHGPLETRWNGVPVTLLFFSVPLIQAERRSMQAEGSRDTSSHFEYSEFNIVQAFAFVPGRQKRKCRRIQIGSIWPEGGDPEIGSVFFANADRDREKELLVLSSCRFNHRALGLSGWNSSVNVFDDLNHVQADTLPVLSKVADRLNSGSSGTREGEQDGTGVFGSAEAVKKRLKKLGY